MEVIKSIFRQNFQDFQDSPIKEQLNIEVEEKEMSELLHESSNSKSVSPKSPYFNLEFGKIPTFQEQSEEKNRVFFPTTEEYCTTEESPKRNLTDIVVNNYIKKIGNKSY